MADEPHHPNHIHHHLPQHLGVESVVAVVEVVEVVEMTN